MRPRVYSSGSSTTVVAGVLSFRVGAVYVRSDLLGSEFGFASFPFNL